MSEMWQSKDGGGESSSLRTPAQEAPWLADLTVFNPEGDLWAWTPRWRMCAYEDVTLVVIPKLHLSQRAVYQLVHVRGYTDVFKDCLFRGASLNKVRFQVFGAGFPFYKTGRPEAHNVFTCLEGGTADIAKIIRLGSSLLT